MASGTTPQQDRTNHLLDEVRLLEVAMKGVMREQSTRERSCAFTNLQQVRFWLTEDFATLQKERTTTNEHPQH